MKKLFIFLTMLVLGIVSSWAEVLTLTPSNGTYKTGDANYVNSITFSTTPSITVTASANNMDKRQTGSYLLWHSGSSGSCTYTISVSGTDGYVITSYTVTGEANTSAQTLTAGSVSHEFAVGTSSSFTVTGLSSASVSFVQTGANASGLKITSISVTVGQPTSEQTAAYNKVLGWASSVFTAEGLVKDASNYSCNALASGDGDGLPALLDNNTSTFCHTAYSGCGTDPGEDHYIQAYIADGTDAFYLYTIKRNNNNRPTQIDITASNDGSSWTNITSLTSGLTTNDNFLSDKISLGSTYKYIRFAVPKTNTGAKFNEHVFFTYSEFWLLPSKTYTDEAFSLVKNLKPAIQLTSDDINNINTIDLAVRTATIAPWKAAFIASAGESSNFGKVGWPSATAYSTFCDAINALTVDDDYESDAETAMTTLWSTVTYPATGYYYLHNKGTGRYAFSDETVSTNQDYLNDESRTSKYIWKVTLDGANVKVYSLTGHGITLNNQGGEQTGNLALETPDANSYKDARGALYMGCIQDPNQNTYTKEGGSAAYVSATNPMKLVYYNGDRTNKKAYWIFESVDASAYDVYTVNIVGAPSNNYVTYTGSATTGNKKVWDGGQYFMTKDAAVTTSDFTPEEVTGYGTEVSISSKTITVTYTIIDYKALVESYFDTDKQTNFANAGKVGYMQNSGDNFTNLGNLILTLSNPAHEYTKSDYDNLVTYYEACAANVKYPEIGKYYLVKNKYNGKYLRVAKGGTRGQVFADLTAAEAAKDASAHIHFVEIESKPYMMSQGQYFNWVWTTTSGYEGYVVEQKDKYVHFANPAVGAVAFSIAYGNGEGQYAGYLGAGYYALKAADSYVVAGSTTDENSNLAQWAFEEVQMINIDLNSDGAVSPTYYATLCLPFDVTITSGANAYTLEESDGWLVPTAVEDNKVPAGTPVLLKGTSALATATINTASAFNSGSPLDCALTGIYFATTVDTRSASGNYVFGKNSSGAIGFYHVNNQNFPLKANRAYMNTSASDARGFSLMFDDVVTGIVSTSGETEEGAVIYNISGQRLNKMQKGINIVNGKKVLF